MSYALQIETFECTETAEEPIELSEEAAELIERMGLTGQASFIKRDDKGSVESRCPYRLMTEEEISVYRTLCPSEVKIEKYDAAPIPVRVLQIAAHAKQVIPGVSLLVWDKEKNEVKDPVLVGCTGYEWSPDKTYILARWGEQLDTFATLFDMASKAVKGRLEADAKKLLSYLSAVHPSQILKHREFKFPEL